MSNSLNALVAEGLTKSFGNKEVLRGVSATFRYGEMTAILGQSGSGKTTLLNILGLLDNHYGGSISIHGELISKKRDNADARNRHIGFVFQSFFLVDYLSVRDNILLPRRYAEKNAPVLDIDKLADSLGIASLLDQKAATLSGGEKQRVALARSLSLHPDILICDEPTGNLDHDNAMVVLKELQMAKKDKAVIIVTHSEDVAAGCDRLLRLQEGRIVHG